jgi:predicted N-acyltransferase
MDRANYVIRIVHTLSEVDSKAWDALERCQQHPSPFMRYAYLEALIESACACADTGWSPAFFLLESTTGLVGASVLFIKTHSFGEYVFDWAWARAYQQHGIPYYPKATAAVPFTPVPGTRLMAQDKPSREALLNAMIQWCQQEKLSSLHLLFCSNEDVETCQNAGLMTRNTVQFHWTQSQPQVADFEQFLATLNQEKRKKIRQERRKVADANVQIQVRTCTEILESDWDFFYRCYEQTYLEHGNPPYLNRDFFRRTSKSMPQNWVMFIASRSDTPIAASLIAVDIASDGSKTAYGRYWGAIESVSCLHFELCYYCPIQWCIANGFERFEGGAQGEHKMARALLPVITRSAHWVAHPEFSVAIANFLNQEQRHIDQYLNDLELRTPLKSSPTDPMVP